MVFIIILKSIPFHLTDNVDFSVSVVFNAMFAKFNYVCFLFPIARALRSANPNIGCFAK